MKERRTRTRTGAGAPGTQSQFLIISAFSRIRVGWIGGMKRRMGNGGTVGTVCVCVLLYIEAA